MFQILKKIYVCHCGHQIFGFGFSLRFCLTRLASLNCCTVGSSVRSGTEGLRDRIMERLVVIILVLASGIVCVSCSEHCVSMALSKHSLRKVAVLSVLNGGN